MNILMTGGTGFIGSAFIERYPDYHYCVVTRRAKHLTPRRNCRFITPEQLAEMPNLDIFCAVINLAGEGIADKRWSKKRKDVICQSRWKITQQLVELFNASSTPPQTFISGSAVGVYGRQQADAIDEHWTDCHSEFSREICQQWEQIAQQVDSVTRLCLLRTGIVLNPKAGALSKMLPPFKLGLGTVFCPGTQYMPWIHLNDQLRAMHFLLTNKQCRGAYNLTAPNPVTNQQFSKALANQLKRPLLFKTPSFVLKLMLGEMSELLIYGQNAIPKQLQQAGFNFDFPRLDQALADCLPRPR